MAENRERFGPDDVHAILARALERPRGTDDFSREELFEVARRAGIADADLEAAIAGVDEDRELAREQARRTRRRRYGFAVHVLVFAILQTMLFLGLGELALPFLVAWGLALTMHGVAVSKPAKVSRTRVRRKMEARRRKEAWRKTATEAEMLAQRKLAELMGGAPARPGGRGGVGAVRVAPPPDGPEVADAELVEPARHDATRRDRHEPTHRTPR